MDSVTHKAVSQRLASASGHLQAITRMAGQDDACCLGLIGQIQAVQAALDKVNLLLLTNHLDTCLATALQGEDAGERERMLQEVAGIFAAYQKTSSFHL